MPLNPTQTWASWGFQAENDPLQRLFCTHYASFMPPITAARCLTCHPDLMDPYEPVHPEITATWVTLEAKNMPLISPEIGDFLTKMTISSDSYGPTEHALWSPLPD